MITHNVKVKWLKQLFKELGVEGIETEMIMKALKPVNELNKKHIRKLTKEFKKHFPESVFSVLNEENPDQILLRFNNIHESIFAKIYLEKLDVRMHFAKNV